MTSHIIWLLSIKEKQAKKIRKRRNHKHYSKKKQNQKVIFFSLDRLPSIRHLFLENNLRIGRGRKINQTHCPVFFQASTPFV